MYLELKPDNLTGTYEPPKVAKKDEFEFCDNPNYVIT